MERRGRGETSQCDKRKKFCGLAPMYYCIWSRDHVFFVAYETLAARVLITCKRLSLINAIVHIWTNYILCTYVHTKSSYVGLDQASALLSSVLFDAKLLFEYILVQKEEDIQKVHTKLRRALA